MGNTYKNFWSLNTDEAVVAGILKNAVRKKAEVFMPPNAQMKDIDLVVVSKQKKNMLSVALLPYRSKEARPMSPGFMILEMVRTACGEFYTKMKARIESDKKTDSE